MNTLIDIDPFSFLDDMFSTGNRALRTMRARAAGRFPPANILTDDTAVIIDLELPGKTASDVELTLEPQAAVIAGKPKNEETGKTDGSSAQNVWSRRIELPFRVDAEKANAKFTNGILRIELPKADAPAVRRIAIAG
ncbi:MAG: Hsp20/alpha crystallin family protein [Kiritimatiellae bacterium]|nr:Hsp20/alpha crystallin family protein [Kiritimatiellia bacterium]